MRQTEDGRNRILLWSNGRNLALVIEWVEGRHDVYDGWNTSPRVVLYEARLTADKAVYGPHPLEVKNQWDIERAQRAVRLGLPATVPERVLEDTSAYPNYETREAYQAALAEYMGERLGYSDFYMKFDVKFEGQEGDEDTEEIPPFPLRALLPDGQVLHVSTRDCFHREGR